jgi:hypothetical protein
MIPMSAIAPALAHTSRWQQELMFMCISLSLLAVRLRNEKAHRTGQVQVNVSLPSLCDLLVSQILSIPWSAKFFLVMSGFDRFSWLVYFPVFLVPFHLVPGGPILSCEKSMLEMAGCCA